jgi:serine/threonine protein kinase
MTRSVLAHYLLQEKIGEGGMGVVYKARDTKLGRVVAVKVLPADMVADPERKRRFIQEAKAASALNHPNIITVHDVSADQGVDFIVMEFVAGKTLEQLITRKPAPVDVALKYAIQVADALAAAHSAGIIHRDLKPGNVMVNEDGRVKVLDFGLAKLNATTRELEASEWDGIRTLEASSPQSLVGSIVGTASYMSPEQAEGRKIDARSDIFAFGALLYEMLTGRRAFQGESHISTLASVIHKDPQPMRGAAVTVPADLEKIAFRCIRKDPQRRFQHMAEVRAALQDLLEELEAGPQPVPAPVGRPRGLRPWLVPTGAVVLSAAAIWYFRQAPPEPPPEPVPLTTDAGRAYEPTFSPDGNSIAYSWNGEHQDNYDIYVRVIGTATALRITSDREPDLSPAWSPDGRSIAFIRRPQLSPASVILVPPLGGHERKLAEIGGLGSICWSPDSKWLFVEERSNDLESLYALSVETGETKKLTNPPPGSRGDRDPAVSPDGQTLAFVRTLASGQGDLYVAPFRGYTALGQPVRVTYTGQITSRPVWLRNGNELVVAGGVMGNPVLARVAAKEKSEPVRIGYAGVLLEAPALSADGHRLAYARLIQDTNIWRVRVPDRPGEMVRPEEFISSTRHDFNPRYSPDGKRVAFSSNRTGAFEVWVADSDGLGAVPVTSFGGARVGSPRWSPDGESIVFDCNDRGEPRIYVVNASGGKPRLIANTGDAAVPSWSHDGKWIYFGSRRTGRNEVWKIPANGGEPVQVTHRGGYAAYETPDGKLLCFTESDGATRLKMISLASPDQEKVLLDWMERRTFTVANDGFWYISTPEHNRRYLRFRNFAGDSARTVAEIEKPVSWGLTASPDGHSVLYAQVDQSGSELMLINNFR